MKLVCLLLLAGLASTSQGLEDATVEEEEGEVVEDLSKYTTEGTVLYKILSKLRHCAGPAVEGDNVTMIM